MIGYVIRGENEAKYWYDKYFTMKEAAEYLEISLYQIRKLVKENRIPYSKSFKQISFHERLLNAWLKGEIPGGRVELILEENDIDIDHRAALLEHYERYPELAPQIQTATGDSIARYIDDQKVTIDAENVTISSQSGPFAVTLSRKFLKQLIRLI